MIKVRLKKSCTVRGILYSAGSVIEVPPSTAERMEQKGLSETLYSGLILPESAKPKKRRKTTKGKKRSTDSF